MHPYCFYGEIGRHEGFKIPCLTRTGSSPVRSINITTKMKETFNNYSTITFSFFSDLSHSLYPYLILLGQSLGIIVPLLISVAYFTLAERKIIAAIQRRKGPNVIGYYGLLQP